MADEGQPNTLRFVLFKEEGVFVAVCLERYIGEQGATAEEVKQRLCTVYRAELDASLARCGEPFGDIQPAPNQYFELWEKGPPDAMRGTIFDKNIQAHALAA